VPYIVSESEASKCKCTVCK